MAQSSSEIKDLFSDGDPAGRLPTTPMFKPIQQPIWTQNKARLIERYLYYFVMITKHGTYIDGFAGPQEPDQPGMWSAKLVLESRPRWLRNFFLCDASKDQVAAIQSLVQSQPARSKDEPKRRIEVIHGDFNARVDEVLRAARIDDKEAAFALLDQRTFECRWDTVAKIAGHKRSGHKIEIFYFLPIKWLHRALSGVTNETSVAYWWGRSDWRQLGDAGTASIRDAVVERFRKELGFASVAPWPIYEREDGGSVMYYMVHATDHPEAPKLMQRAYKKALLPLEPPDQLHLLFADGDSA